MQLGSHGDWTGGAERDKDWFGCSTRHILHTGFPMRVRSLVLVLLWFGCSASAAAAQVPELGLAVGLAPVSGSSRETRETGLHAALSVGLGTRSPGFGVRADLVWEHLPGKAAPASDASWRYGDLDIRSVRGSILYTFAGGSARPYLLLGGGAYDLRIPEQPNPYGTVAGLHAGVGLCFAAGSLALSAELLGVSPLTDYGGATDFRSVGYFPLSVGVRF
jgi:hypothetical protein